MTKYLLTLPALFAVAAAAAETPSPKTLLPELRKGGYVLFIRHAQTNPDQADTDPLHLDNVKAQRQLTDRGREQARALGGAFRALKIPIAKVVASKFERARETAALLALGDVVTSLDVTDGGLVVSPRENQRRAKALRALLSAVPPKGKNLVVVSHRPSLQDAAGKEFGDVGEGEVVIFKPLGEDKFELRARVASEAWVKWSK